MARINPIITFLYYPILNKLMTTYTFEIIRNKGKDKLTAYIYGRNYEEAEYEVSNRYPEANKIEYKGEVGK